VTGQKEIEQQHGDGDVVDKLRQRDDTADSSTATGVQEDSPSSDEAEDQRVPYERFKKVNDELKKLRQELDAARAEGDKSNVDKALRLLSRKAEEGEDEFGESIPDEMKAPMREALLLKHVIREEPNLTARQMEAVVSVLDSLDNRVSVQKAILLAKEDNPGLWRKASPKSEDTESKEPPFQGQKPGSERQARSSEDEKTIDQLQAALRNPHLSHNQRVPILTQLRVLGAKARRK